MADKQCNFAIIKNDKQMKRIFLDNWNIIRVFRLLVGIIIIVQAVVSKDFLLAIAGFAFTVMALFNIGCCGTRGCRVSPKQKQTLAKDISYEEVA